MFKDAYKREFDSIQPDERLLGRIERMARTADKPPRKVSRRLTAAIAIALSMIIVATALAVGGDLLRSLFAQSGADDLAGRVKDINAFHSEDGFAFSIDEALREGDTLYLSCTVRVPSDGNTYMYALCRPEIESCLVSSKNGLFINETSSASVFLAGGEYPATASLVLPMSIAADDPLIEQGELTMQVCFLSTNRPAKELDNSNYRAKLIEGGGYYSQVLSDSDYLYFDRRNDAGSPQIMLEFYPEIDAVQVEKENEPVSSGSIFYNEDGNPVLVTWGEAGSQTLCIEDLERAGLGSVAATRSVCCPLPADKPAPSLTLSQRVFQMDGYSIEIKQFEFTHFSADITAWIRADKPFASVDPSYFDLSFESEDWENPLQNEPLARYYTMVLPDGSPLCPRIEAGGSSFSFIHDPDTDEMVLEVGYRLEGIIPLTDIDTVLFVPHTWDATWVHPESDELCMDEAIPLPVGHLAKNP